MCKEYQSKICEIESNKYDTEKEVEYKDYMVSTLDQDKLLHRKYAKFQKIVPTNIFIFNVRLD